MSILETERKEGREEGLEEGLEKGREEGREKVARKLFSKEFDLETISQVTEYSLEALRALLFSKPEAS